MGTGRGCSPALGSSYSPFSSLHPLGWAQAFALALAPLLPKPMRDFHPGTPPPSWVPLMWVSPSRD